MSSVEWEDVEIEQAFEALSKAPTSRSLPRFRIISDEDLESIPAPQPLIAGILSQQNLAAIIGPYSAFKTFLALDLAMSIGTGRPWLGRHTHCGDVVYVCAEGQFGMQKRVAAWKLANNFRGPANVYFVPQSVVVSEPFNVEGILAQLEDIGVQPVAIFIDTLSRNFKGNENSPEDMSAFVRGCDRLKDSTGATVVVIHHEGHSNEGRGRGHSSFPAALDTEIVVSKTGSRLTVKCSRQKEAEEFEPIFLEAVPAGESLVLVEGTRSEIAGPLTANDEHALEVLRVHAGLNGLRHSEWRAEVLIPYSSFNASLKRLRDGGYVSQSGGRYKPAAKSVVQVQEGSRSRSNGSVDKSSPIPLPKRVGLGLDTRPKGEPAA